MTKGSLFIAAMPGFENILQMLQDPQNMKALCDTMTNSTPQPRPDIKPSGMGM